MDLDGRIFLRSLASVLGDELEERELGNVWVSDLWMASTRGLKKKAGRPARWWWGRTAWCPPWPPPLYFSPTSSLNYCWSISHICQVVAPSKPCEPFIPCSWLPLALSFLLFVSLLCPLLFIIFTWCRPFWNLMSFPCMAASSLDLHACGGSREHNSSPWTHLWSLVNNHAHKPSSNHA